MTEKACIVMLEDSAERVGRFEASLKTLAAPPILRCWCDAHRMIRECPAYLGDAVLICLDHDLDPIPGDAADPGDGLDVARFLSARRVACPVLIHSSNGDGARRMVGEFELAGCEVSTILPLGVQWIEIYWMARVRELVAC